MLSLYGLCKIDDGVGLVNIRKPPVWISTCVTETKLWTGMQTNLPSHAYKWCLWKSIEAGWQGTAYDGPILGLKRTLVSRVVNLAPFTCTKIHFKFVFKIAFKRNRTKNTLKIGFSRRLLYQIQPAQATMSDGFSTWSPSFLAVCEFSQIFSTAQCVFVQDCFINVCVYFFFFLLLSYKSVKIAF